MTDAELQELVQKLARVPRDALESTPGWLSPQAMRFTELLLGHQSNRGWIKGALEFGVFKGKYLGLIAFHHANLQVPLVGVDAFLAGFGVKLEERWVESAKAEMLRNIGCMAGPVGVELIRAFTNEIDPADLLNRAPDGYSFISIDAGHDAEDLLVDVGLADRLLSDEGVAAFDDVFNAATPGVAEGFFGFFSRNLPALAPFATCGNKVFCSRPDLHQDYLTLALKIGMSAREHLPELAKSTDMIEANNANGWTPHLLGYPIAVLG